MSQTLPEPSGADTSLAAATETLFTPEELRRLRENLIAREVAQAKYLRAHPEIGDVMRSAVSHLVRAQPEDPIVFLTNFFTSRDLEEEHRVLCAREADRQWRTRERREEAARAERAAYQAGQEAQESFFREQMRGFTGEDPLRAPAGKVMSATQPSKDEGKDDDDDGVERPFS